MRIILWLHRYLGVAVGLVMTLWCLSGFVMLYRGYPALAPAQRLAGLETLDLAGRIDPARLSLGEGALAGFRIEMLAGRPVLKLGGGRMLDLRTGAAIAPLAPQDALRVAGDFASGTGSDGRPRAPALIDQDQWTVEDAGRRGPVYRIGLDGARGGVLYVAQRTGEVVQATDRASRLWAWLGAVPHWLYPTVLRRNAALWSAVVVWAALIGCFLTLTGLFVGVTRLKRYPGGRWSPYRGWHYWHHLAGLVFGVLTLTWVASGLLTMTPWGLLESSVGEAERRVIRGDIDPGDLRRFLAAAPRPGAGRLVALEAAPLGGRLYVLARFGDGAAVRLDRDGAPAPLRQGELASALARLDGRAVGPLTLLRRPDAYYYPGYERPAPLPVWRAERADADHRAYYFDPVSGDLVLALDATARASRWIRTGLHDLDFPVLRTRPLWDLVALTLLAGVTASSATGAWLGLKRLAHDLRRLRRRT